MTQRNPLILGHLADNSGILARHSNAGLYCTLYVQVHAINYSIFPRLQGHPWHCLRHFEDGVSMAEDSEAFHRLLTAVHPVDLSIPEILRVEDVFSLRLLLKVPDRPHRNFKYSISVPY
jgi:hypothetical protein